MKIVFQARLHFIHSKFSHKNTHIGLVLFQSAIILTTITVSNIRSLKHKLKYKVVATKFSIYFFITSTQGLVAFYEKRVRFIKKSCSRDSIISISIIKMIYTRANV